MVWKRSFLNFSSLHNVLKSKAFVSRGVQSDTHSKHYLRHSKSSSWNLSYLITSLSMQALAKSSSYDNFFYLDALQCSHSWCGYTFHTTMTGYVVGPQLRAFHSWVYHFWMSPEWNTASHLTMREQEWQSSLPVWDYHLWGRWRRTLFVAHWGRT